jgi:hypothetical protein
MKAKIHTLLPPALYHLAAGPRQLRATGDAEGFMRENGICGTSVHQKTPLRNIIKKM